MGGNVFKDGEGRPQTQRINQTDVATTVQWLERLTGVDFTTERDATGRPRRWIGSTGRRPTSGDIDLAIDSNLVNKDELYNRLVDWAKSQKLDPKDWIRKSGASIHVKTPINGDPKLGLVQTDLMFMPNVDWGTWALKASHPSEYSGSDRNIVVNSIAKSLGWKLHQGKGILDRKDNSLITDDPDQAAKLLLNRSARAQDLETVETILAALQRDADRDKKLADARQHFANTGVPFVESIDTDTDVNWLARLRDRIVNQGMWVLIEDQQIKETEKNIGGRDKGIPHIEDLVFRKGMRGVEEAKGILQHVSDDAATTTTVKWDGRPAVIFGRKPDTGEFVLTDTAGWQAQGYDGLFTSYRALEKDMARRDQRDIEREREPTRLQTLAPVYRTLWPLLEQAWPNTLRGFVQGDLLYYPQKPWQSHAGNVEFQPNTVFYRIPVSSELGQQIQDSEVGIALHTEYSEPGSARQPIGKIKFNPVPGLLLILPISGTAVQINKKLLTQLNKLTRSHGAAISQLFDPQELRAQKITDLASLCVDFINSRVGTNFDNLAQGFVDWLPSKVTNNKYRNILTYLQSPKTNVQALEAAFQIWTVLHELKMDMLQQLDVANPGHEGWVMATPAGYAKAVNRLPGGFTAQNREKNNPKT